MQRKIVAGVVQMQAFSFELEKNLKLALDLASQAYEQGAQLVVFPELFDSGYCVHTKDAELASHLESLSSPTLQKMHAFAKQTGVVLVGCGIEKEGGGLYDSAYIISKEGLVGKYRKIYLWGDEVDRFERGENYPVFEINLGGVKVKIGLQICYEVGFPEGSRALALQGAEVLIFSAAFSQRRGYAWDLGSRARALENGAFVLASNRSGSEEHPYSKANLEFAGRSKIINPMGSVVCEAQSFNEVLVAELNLDMVADQRKEIPYLRDLGLVQSLKTHAS
ncbi:carbon-nitrogen hydrolase family protein [Helicobacter sp. NHP22-001]|uniref:carbon-nitrogen hydrolase family protein n=1 Tax=Helicobacter sp. NHP22-001 TaxID=3040202 RepID=UPI00244D9505|nr:carbon-nitrogen hydrolase family protein [Helicobacter sp. NHP22-001]GMB96817.1 Putative N-carbamoyl-D-amino acid amidohydrolase [Helicobacter sp. NHP22-001]